MRMFVIKQIILCNSLTGVVVILSVWRVALIVRWQKDREWVGEREKRWGWGVTFYLTALSFQHNICTVDGIEHWWNDTNRRKSHYLGGLPHCHYFVRHAYHAGTNLVSNEGLRAATVRLSSVTALVKFIYINSGVYTVHTSQRTVLPVERPIHECCPTEQINRPTMYRHAEVLSGIYSNQ
jgi:hypothetical protein